MELLFKVTIIFSMKCCRKCRYGIHVPHDNCNQLHHLRSKVKVTSLTKVKAFAKLMLLISREIKKQVQLLTIISGKQTSSNVVISHE